MHQLSQHLITEPVLCGRERSSSRRALVTADAEAVRLCRAAPLKAGGGADPKWRFMARIGPRPAATQYAELNAEPVNPEGAVAAVWPPCGSSYAIVSVSAFTLRTAICSNQI